MFKSKRTLLAAVSFALLLGACEDKEKVTPTKVTAAAGADQNVKVGDLVTLDGGGSSDSGNKPFQFRWAFSQKPAGSNVTLNKPTEQNATFTPDQPGDYELELTVSNENGESKDKVLVTAAIIQPIVLETNIKAKTVLTDRINNPAFPDYIVNDNVAVNAELEIKPGVVIAFARDTRLEVNDKGGVLIAKGDSLNPIRLIGKEASKGYWAGMIVRSASSANLLEWVEVLHTGSKAIYSTTKAAVSLMSGSKAELALKNTSFQDNAGYGLYVQAGAILSGFSRNVFKNNAEAGISLDATNVKNLDYNSVFTGGNGRNVVEVYASALRKNATEEVVWNGFKDKTPYRILESLSSDANWKLMPGVVIEMSRNARMSIDDGYINAVGTEASKIVIKGAENSAAYWRGMICFSTSNLNVFNFAEISGGGSSALVSGKKVNIAVYGSLANMQIKNSKISGSGGYGIYVNYQATINGDVETANTFTDNAEGKILKE
ncbi:PKD domain-containing protein [Dyadobacter luticola]|uniref:PKD domain-containing protein n=1 Tax=Dyadobacter luticola TaxID=1979387 RepID=A0A5R9KX41_9BACT|nr:PKD domain-containing protein [Dyadobacter luticola]TLV00708.1 PKD domain-containing protein [Dyadobacter luticola]